MDGLEIITFLENNCATVFGTIGSIIGGLLTAIFLRYNTSTTEFEKIKAGRFDDVANELLKSGKMTYSEYYKANNFLTIAKKADEFYAEKRSNNEIYDFDWFMRFYEAVGNVSDEDMQDLWAKVLAGELLHPSSFSYKTLEILRNLSRRDAELFVKICEHSFMVGEPGAFLPNEEEYFEQFDIKYTDIMRMSELGLMFNDANISLNFDNEDDSNILFINNGLLLMISSLDEKGIRFGLRQFPFTGAGKELSSLVGKSASDDDLVKYGILLSRNSNKYHFSIHKVIYMTMDSVKYDDLNLMSNF